jgi:LmbE family N-acetylglucosaminyl deacetylase
MKPTRKSPAKTPPILVFGAHPDDIEFGCGGVVARETQSSVPVHLVVSSRGEAASHGTPAQRTAEAKKAARILGATLEFLKLDGDAHLEIRVAHSLKIAAIIRRIRPSIILAPTLVENQHPDHYRLGRLVRDAARLARYGGVRELSARPSHAVQGLFFYALSPESEPAGAVPLLIDVSPPEILSAWKSAMEAHVSQVSARGYVELQLARARLHGLRAGIGHAIPLFPNDAPVFTSLTGFRRGARQF